MAGQEEAMEGFLDFRAATRGWGFWGVRDRFFYPKKVVGVGGHCCRLLVGRELSQYVRTSMRHCLCNLAWPSCNSAISLVWSLCGTIILLARALCHARSRQPLGGSFLSTSTRFASLLSSHWVFFSSPLRFQIWLRTSPRVSKFHFQSRLLVRLKKNCSPTTPCLNSQSFRTSENRPCHAGICVHIHRLIWWWKDMKKNKRRIGSYWRSTRDKESIKVVKII